MVSLLVHAPKAIVRRIVPADGLDSELHPVLRRIYAARGVHCGSSLDYGLGRLLPCDGLGGIDAAVDLLVRALERGERILVVGDFDADGATSSALAVRALRMMGAHAPGCMVPNRFAFGYGLTPEIVVVAAERTPDLIITVDNGVSSHEGVAAARARGIRVLVTDHHLPGALLPQADAVVNPNLPGDAFPSKHLAGVGVIFYVMVALRARLRALGWLARRNLADPSLASLLDLVALGTVADVVCLDDNNRILVEQGLRRMRAGKCCPGVQALAEVAGRRLGALTSTDLAYVLGPRLNAAGRLQDMSVGIACLLADDPAEARCLARTLDELNQERRRIEADMQLQAQDALDSLRVDQAQCELPLGLCLFQEDWHEGVVGILAGRVKDALHRPAVAFAVAGDGQLKGSARSVRGLHMRDILEAIATLHPGLLTRFGGHAMAAGLSLPRAHYEAFQTAFDAEVCRRADPAGLHGIIYSDGELAQRDLADARLAELLRRAGPWGQGFPEPVFDGVFAVLQRRIVGARHLRMVLRPRGTELQVDAIAFHATDAGWPAGVPELRMAYRLDINEYRDQRRLQLVAEYLQQP